MIHPIPENSHSPQAKPNWRKRCAITLLTSTIVASLFWSLAGSFTSAFIITTVCILSLMWAVDSPPFNTTYNHGGNWLASHCRHWRLTHRGILLYNCNAPGPCLFLPWCAIHSATLQKNNILLEDASNNTFYELPIAENMQSEYLAHIQKQLTPHHDETRQKNTIHRPIFYMWSPHQLHFLHHIKCAIPMLILGFSCPFFWPGEIVPCLLCLGLAGSLGTLPLTEFEDAFCPENYLGEEIRRSKQGIHIRMDNGILCFIPWSFLDKGTQMEDNTAFLQQRNGIYGICIEKSSAGIPIPLTRRFLKRHRWTRRLIVFSLVFLLIVIAFIWCHH